MRILADENFPKPIVDLLRDAGHDVKWARTDLSGWKDLPLLELAESEDRLILTLDKDFWQLAIQRKIPMRGSGVILFRAHPCIPQNLRPIVMAFLALDNNWAGHISTISNSGIQMMAVRRPAT